MGENRVPWHPWASLGPWHPLAPWRIQNGTNKNQGCFFNFDTMSVPMFPSCNCRSSVFTCFFDTFFSRFADLDMISTQKKHTKKRPTAQQEQLMSAEFGHAQLENITAPSSHPYIPGCAGNSTDLQGRVDQMIRTFEANISIKMDGLEWKILLKMDVQTILGDNSGRMYMAYYGIYGIW